MVDRDSVSSSSQSITEGGQGRNGQELCRDKLTRPFPMAYSAYFLVPFRTICLGVTPSTPITDQENVPEATLMEAMPQCRLLFS